VANNGQTALRLTRELLPDVVVMDVRLPTLNGIEATRQILQIHPRCRVVGLSELYAEWTARMQRGRGRHAAISRNVNTWSNYKSWSDKVRQSWESDVSPAKKPK
jgi:DNA-binding NarL/FixJ family response regulator